MKDTKMISIDQFSADERLVVEDTLQGLIQKYRERTGKEPDGKKEKELTAEARQQVMSVKLEKEKAQAEKMKKKPVRRKKPESLKESEVSEFNWSASVAKGRRR
ncbi:hypothetical protein A9B99_15415 [Mangrovibacter phragmitis]|jgi:hypothetical protein|uniref:DUF3811 domain-containing protein n=1 Tax=Mangrovibacter phragmitis TaxID=1691903 RepID=A0A1B7KYZ4_9ENTR|nr:hypothetical protein [Mangrovibacter phragmitis]OAT75266.1 hypothetical protein A9B99_15415 [Mangrovibacter phragmitis]